MEDGRRVVIDPADVKDSDGTVKGALTLCCGSIGEPMGYNPFQSMYFALMREHKCRDEGAVPEETSATRQKFELCIMKCCAIFGDQNIGPRSRQRSLSQ